LHARGSKNVPKPGNWPHPHQVGDGGRLARAGFAKRGVGVCAKTRASTESLRGRAEASTFSRVRAGTRPLRRRGAGTGPETHRVGDGEKSGGRLARAGFAEGRRWRYRAARASTELPRVAARWRHLQAARSGNRPMTQNTKDARPDDHGGNHPGGRSPKHYQTRWRRAKTLFPSRLNRHSPGAIGRPILCGESA
jgi:hypothetical protein